MSQRLRYYFRRFARLPLPIFVLSVCGILVVMSLLLSLLHLDVKDIVPQELTTRFVLVAILLTPVVETVIGQLLPIELIRRLRLPDWLGVIVSALLFGSLHYYSFLTTFYGLVLAVAFVARRRAVGLPSAFIAVMLAHTLNNALAIVERVLL